MQGKNRILVAVGIIVASFVAAAIMNMAGFKSVHMEQKPGAASTAPGGPPAGSVASRGSHRP